MRKLDLSKVTVTSTDDDLVRYLQPDVVVRLGRPGEPPIVERNPAAGAPPRPRVTMCARAAAARTRAASGRQPCRALLLLPGPAPPLGAEPSAAPPSATAAPP